jgi:hypothetical protein
VRCITHFLSIPAALKVDPANPDLTWTIPKTSQEHMRPIKSLLALSVVLVALFAATSPASALQPDVTADSATGGPTSFTVEGETDTHGSPAEVWVYYFPMIQTTNCSMPDPADVWDGMQQSTPVPIGAADGYRPITAEVTLLPNETSYCYQLVVRTTDEPIEEGTSFFWSVDTTAPDPVVADATYDPDVNTITYHANFTANTNWYTAYVEAEYFAKDSGTCNEHDGETQHTVYWGEDWNGFKGFTEQAVSATVGGLTTDTTYCVRLTANNGHGDATPTEWEEVSTFSPVAASVSSIELSPPSGSDDANLKLTMNDNGAAASAGTNNHYDIYLYDVGAGRCTPQDYFGGDLVVGWSSEFAGEYDFNVGVNGLELGKPYCATVFLSSAWGSSYDTTINQEVWFGEDPQVDLGTATSTHSSISIPDSSITPGHLATDYEVEYFAKQQEVACEDDNTTERQHGATSTIDSALGSSASVTPSIGGLAPQTTYCFRVLANNAWGSAASAWDSIATTKPPVAATITNMHIAPNTSGAQRVRFYATLDDGAPAETSKWSLQSFVGDVCNGTVADSLLNQSLTQPGEINRAVGYANTGQAFCVKVSIDSGFGEDYDAVAYFNYRTPGKPEFTGVDSSSTTSSITIGSTLAATHTATNYHVEWFKPTVEGCDEEVTLSVGADQTFSPNNAAGHVSSTVTGLQPGTRYCVRLVARNDWGSTVPDGIPDFAFHSVTTLAQAAPPGGNPTPPTCTDTRLVPLRKAVYKGKYVPKKGAKAKKYSVTVTTKVVGKNLKLSVKQSGVSSKKVKLTFNKKVVGKTATLTTTGTLKVTIPKGTKSMTRSLSVTSVPDC